MKQEAQNYNSGKKQERDADSYLLGHGYIRPIGKQKSNIVKTFANKGYKLKPRAFDLVDHWVSRYWDNIKDLESMFEFIILYELKSAGANRIKPIREDWQGLGFTYSSNEDYNWELLGDEKYKFIFVDCLRRRHLVLKKSDWINNSRSTPTWSIFIKSLGQLQ